jgi:K+-dependent Na+/Ca+ exchanger-like protein
MPTDVNIFLTILLLIVGGAILISGGEVFVRGAVRLATLFRISPLIIGLMIVAPATSAPELSVSLIGVFGKNPNPDIAIGNVVGSNIANIPLILGLSSLIRPLVVSSSIIKREIPMMIVASFLLWGIGFFTVKTGPAAETLHRLPLWGGILFLALWVFHNVLIVKEAKRERNKEIADQIVEETQARGIRPTGLSGFLATPLLLGIGLSMLVFGSDLFVAEAKIIAEYCGVSELIVSLTILAVGTSLPETDRRTDRGASRKRRHRGRQRCRKQHFQSPGNSRSHGRCRRRTDHLGPGFDVRHSDHVRHRFGRGILLRHRSDPFAQGRNDFAAGIHRLHHLSGQSRISFPVSSLSLRHRFLRRDNGQHRVINGLPDT